MKRPLRSFSIALAVLIGGGFVWGAVQDLFGDAKSAVRNSAVILLMVPDYRTDPPEWVVESVFKGRTDPRFKIPLGSRFSAAPLNFSVTGNRPDSLIVFYAPRFLDLGPLRAQRVTAVFSGKILHFGMTKEEFIDSCSENE